MLSCKKLIEKLSKLPPETEIIIKSTYGETYHELGEATFVEDSEAIVLIAGPTTQMPVMWKDLMSERNQKEVGTFEVTSGIIAVSDPCYDMDAWCRDDIDNAKNGKWTATIKMCDEDAWDDCVAALIIKHADHKDADTSRRELLNADIGVDSGRCGFYDLPIFREKNNVPADAKLASYIGEEDGKWYSMCCAATHGDHGMDAGIIPGGVVSSSGFGDGWYSCYVDKDENGQATGATLVFIGEDEEEEEED